MHNIVFISDRFGKSVNIPSLSINGGNQYVE
jgi:hypothetical protein